MRLCEICGTEEMVTEEGDESQMTILGVCESCRNDFNRSHDHQSMYPEG